MKISVTGIALRDLDVDLLVLPVVEGTPDVRALDLPGAMLERASADFSGKLEETLLLYPGEIRASRIVLLGLGPKDTLDSEAVRQAAAAGATLAVERKVQTVAMHVPDGLGLDAESAGQALVEGFLLASYRFTRYKAVPEEPPAKVERLVLQATADEKAVRRGAERGRILAEAACTARDLVNLSPDEKTPTLLARAIERSAKKHGYEADVWDKALIEEEGMGGLLAVNRGSVEPPTFTVLTWKPEHALNEHPVVLVGKGVVFDTGGLSLKPTKDSMDHMKADMAGAAAVVGALEAVARLELPLYVVGLIPATDNRPGGNAYVPGDVVRMHSGKTVEVLNTDAEGRLLLADALSYAKMYHPELVIDLATLTGAVIIALGTEAAAVMTNRADEAVERLQEAGRRCGEQVYPLPMYEAYGKLLESDVADLKNVGGREAGTITAGKFLEQFVDYPWMHLDIAGTAFLHRNKPYRPKGGTGFGVRLLAEFLRDYANPKRKR